MKSRQASLFPVVLVVGALIAGCGGSSSSTQTFSVAHAPEAVQKAFLLCQHVIRLAPYLSASDKATLEGACTKGANGGTEKAQNAFRLVCEEVIKTTPTSVTERERARAGCRSSLGTVTYGR
jgi:hypothetical protein